MYVKSSRSWRVNAEESFQVTTSVQNSILLTILSLVGLRKDRAEGNVVIEIRAPVKVVMPLLSLGCLWLCQLLL